MERYVVDAGAFLFLLEAPGPHADANSHTIALIGAFVVRVGVVRRHVPSGRWAISLKVFRFK
jgi:hypothetical protein